MQVARNIMVDPYLLPGGGAAEMALAQVRDNRTHQIKVHVGAHVSSNMMTINRDSHVTTI